MNFIISSLTGLMGRPYFHNQPVNPLLECRRTIQEDPSDNEHVNKIEDNIAAEDSLYLLAWFSQNTGQISYIISPDMLIKHIEASSKLIPIGELAKRAEPILSRPDIATHLTCCRPGILLARHVWWR